MMSSKKKLLSTTARPKTIERDPLKADFRNFLWLVWHHLGLPDPTPLQYDIAYWLQHGPTRAVIAALRGIGKSWITSAFVCWLLYCNPQLKILVVSASKERADNFTIFTMRLINEMEVLQFLRPRDDQRNSKISFDVGPARPDHAPSVKSVGITGQIAGSRADVIVADDIEVPNNSDTKTKRDQLVTAVKEFDAVLKTKTEGRIRRVIFLGTPQTEESIYNQLNPAIYVTRIWPSRYPTKDKLPRMEAKLAPYILDKIEKDPSLCEPKSTPSGGAPTDERFGDEDLIEREMSYGRSGYALQFQIDTSLSDAERYPLKLSDLVVFPCDPFRGPSDLAWATGIDNRLDKLPAVGLSGDAYYSPIFVAQEFVEWEGSVMFVDPSGRGKDETAFAVVKMLHGRLFLTDMGAFLGGYDDTTLEAIIMAARKQQVNLILCEPNYGGGMFTQLLAAKAQKLYPVSVEDASWANTQKEARIIDTLEPVMNQHRLVIAPSVVEWDYASTEKYPGETANQYRLGYQMTRITREKGALIRYDRLDSLAGAVAHWTEFMNRDAEDAHLANKEAMLEAELEKIMEFQVGGSSAYGGPPAPSKARRWASSTLRGKR